MRVFRSRNWGKLVVDKILKVADLDIHPRTVRENWNEAQLYEFAVASGEARVAKGGALVVETGKHTGRSAKDKFTVRDVTTEDTVWWDNNAAMTPAHFEVLWSDFRAHLAGKDLFQQDGFRKTAWEPTPEAPCSRRAQGLLQRGPTPIYLYLAAC